MKNSESRIMTTPEKGQLVTANRLRDGIAVFLTRSGEWSEMIDEAVLALEPQAAAALEARAKDDEKKTLVTGAYLIDAERLERPRARRPHPRAHARAWAHRETGPRQAGRGQGRGLRRA